jgi:hypothetical protein
MKPKARDSALYLALAHRRAMQLRQAVGDLLQVLEEPHESWLDLTIDVDCIERRLRGALDRANGVFREDPATYTPYPPDLTGAALQTC